MSLFDEIRVALDELKAESGQTVTIDGVTYPAIVSQVAVASEFLPGAELQTAQLTARVSRTRMSAPPATQTTLAYDGTDYRIETVSGSRHSCLLGLTALEN